MPTKIRKTRVGPSMLFCLWVLDNNHNLLSKHQLALAVGPNGSNQYGDEIVMRCINAGLVFLDAADPRAPRNSLGVPRLTDAGRAVLAERDA